jgi:hypothetical protein
MTSLRPAMAEMIPRLEWKPVLKDKLASLLTKAANSFSSSVCNTRVPLR